MHVNVLDFMVPPPREGWEPRGRFSRTTAKGRRVRLGGRSLSLKRLGSSQIIAGADAGCRVRRGFRLRSSRPARFVWGLAILIARAFIPANAAPGWGRPSR